MPPDSSFQPEHNNTKHSIVLQDAHIALDGKDGLSSLSEGEYSSTISKSPTDEGRTNLFQMDIPTTGPSIASKLYPIPLKYQKFIGEEIRLLEHSGCISKNLSSWATPVIVVPKKARPLNPQKQQPC